MKFAIYEEFPEDKNLGKLVHMDFPADIIVASKNLREFQDFERQIKYTNSNVQRVGYWPVLSKEEGYWMSPFAKRTAIERIISELEERLKDDEKLLLKWDAELPLAFRESRISLYKELRSLNFLKNKARIQNFLKQHSDYGLDLMTAEWPTFMLPELFQESIGVAFNPGFNEYNSEKGRMLYSSFRKYFYSISDKKLIDNLFYWFYKKQIRKGLKDYGERFWVGIGCLDTGILKTEPITTYGEFEQDLRLAKIYGAERILIFRLGGLNREYSSIIKQYLS